MTCYMTMTPRTTTPQQQILFIFLIQTANLNKVDEEISWHVILGLKAHDSG